MKVDETEKEERKRKREIVRHSSGETLGWGFEGITRLISSGIYNQNIMFACKL